MYTTQQIEEMYYPWKDHGQYTYPISEGVHYVGQFQGFGPVMARHRLWRWDQGGTAPRYRSTHCTANQEFAEKSLDYALSKLKDCLILSTTASYYSQFQGSCLLKSRGFKLLQNRCYKHPKYPSVSKCEIEHPGVPDKYLHWEHIWYKVQGPNGPKKIGVPNDSHSWPSLNNCGVDCLVGLEQIQHHDAGQNILTANLVSPCDRQKFLAVAYLPRGTNFPKGWHRFFSAEDYKLGVNFENLTDVQKCPHNFDLKVFEGWDPDFNKWTLA